MTKKQPKNVYEAPEMAIIPLVMEQCIAASTTDALQEMNENPIFDESFTSLF